MLVYNVLVIGSVEVQISHAFENEMYQRRIPEFEVSGLVNLARHYPTVNDQFNNRI